MKKIPTDLNGFTLIELMVVLILSGLVVSATYYAFNVIQQYYFDFSIRKETIQQLLSFDTQLQKDFDTAEKIIGDGRTIKFYKKEQSVDYRFHSKRIMRFQGSRTDTLLLELEDVRVSQGPNNLSYPHGEIIDLLWFTCVIGEERFAFFYKKNYAANVLIEEFNLEN